MQSALPWDGNSRLKLDLKTDSTFTLHLRIPSWAGKTSIRVNSEEQLPSGDPSPVTRHPPPVTASGYDPRLSAWFPITRFWQPGDVLELNFEMPILLRRASPKVRGHQGKVTVTRGPLVYCLESVDNPDVDIFTARLDPSSLQAEFSSLLGGTEILHGKTTDGQRLTFLPYFLWANRGESQMTVWVNAERN
jgi:DUF1680 family protein